ncbi:pyridoxamine 5'-phosphate oxidase [Limnobacter sp. P1]|uniref:pyridoxamine 5'-phosphate oxidase n=1 Tax=Limnobacter olei TaxID=3031298 RepID=UPI0023B1E34F|nr:pyridoxamine 5'-phosphate oxidase [Limnobacter sp. P1]
MSIADLRKDYTQATLDEADALANPLDFFKLWFDQALNADLPEPNAMTLATVNAKGRPSARIVLIKGLDARGITFFTNYESRKGQELAQNPHAAILFHWTELERQVRIEGRVEKCSPEESDAYYLSRPAGSRLGAWASPQSQVIDSRAVLEARVRQAQEEQRGDPQTRPPFWGGYRLVPDFFEFWQGRPSRLHDRLAYTLQGDSWAMSRLAP